MYMNSGHVGDRRTSLSHFNWCVKKCAQDIDIISECILRGKFEFNWFKKVYWDGINL